MNKIGKKLLKKYLKTDNKNTNFQLFRTKSSIAHANQTIALIKTLMKTKVYTVAKIKRSNLRNKKSQRPLKTRTKNHHTKAFTIHLTQIILNSQQRFQYNQLIQKEWTRLCKLNFSQRKISISSKTNSNSYKVYFTNQNAVSV